MAKLLLAVGFWVIVGAMPAYACRFPIMKGRPWADRVEMAKEDIESADVIIYGKVVAIENTEKPAEIRVLRQFKGAAQPFFLVKVGTSAFSCGDYRLHKIGEKKIFLLNRQILDPGPNAGSVIFQYSPTYYSVYSYTYKNERAINSVLLKTPN